MDDQLETYIHDMQFIKEFLAFKGIGQLTEKMVEIKKDVLRVAIATDKINANVTNEYIYSVVTLALILSVAAATLKRVFFSNKHN